MPSAAGVFETIANPQPPYDTVDGVALGRMTISKKFSGALDATGVVEMLTAGGAVPGSAGYVAIERVTGTLDGRTGTFVLQHSGSMNRGKADLSISIVPDSGTGALTGIAGAMVLGVADGRKTYALEYTLPEV